VEDRATATDDTYRKFREVWTVVFETCEGTDRQTDRQTYRHDDRNTSHPYGGTK